VKIPYEPSKAWHVSKTICTLLSGFRLGRHNLQRTMEDVQMRKAVADVLIKKFVPIEAHAWFLAPATSLEGRGSCFSCTREIGEHGAAPHSVLFTKFASLSVELCWNDASTLLRGVV
jgi:hypothetical protein